jgi:flavodoxin
MKTVVVYDTAYGNTEQVARVIAGALRAFGPVALVLAGEAQPSALAEADLLVFGCPTQHHRATREVVRFVESIEPDAIREAAVAIFDTRYRSLKLVTGSGGDELSRRIGRVGGNLIAPVKSFFVSDRIGPLEEHQLEHAKAWARSLAASYDERRLPQAAEGDNRAIEDWATATADAFVLAIIGNDGDH